MNQGNPPIQTVLPKDTQVPFIVVTDANDDIIPRFIRRKLNGNISKQIDAKAYNTYGQDDFTSLFSSISDQDFTKDRCILLKAASTETGGIAMDETDDAGRKMELYNVFKGMERTNANAVLPGNGPRVGVRRVHIPIDENDLFKMQTKVQLDPAHQNTVADAEVFVSTSATCFVTPGNERLLDPLYVPVALYGKVCNLPKLLRPYDSHPIAADLENEYLNVIHGNNTLGFFERIVNGKIVKIPYLVQKCIAIVENDLGGKDYFFQFFKTILNVNETFWFTYQITKRLSQFRSNTKCCVAFVSFLDYHGIAPIHNLECAMHTRFRFNPNDDWNDNIGYFRVSQSGNRFTDTQRINAITLFYGYMLLQGIYPFFEDTQEPPELEEANLDVVLAKKLDQINGLCMQLPEEDKIRFLGKLDDILSEFNNGVEPMTFEEMADANEFLE